MSYKKRPLIPEAAINEKIIEAFISDNFQGDGLVDDIVVRGKVYRITIEEREKAINKENLAILLREIIR